ncbi:MAG: helix-turn-helix transcriptional regulator [Deltaproteobacteria bacterium]|nr:helix-turn-helix transcriptional regulator [Deltaproteobacteria bacterium]
MEPSTNSSASIMRARVAANIKRCRQRAGFTQSALAGRLGVSQRYVAMLEQDARNLSIETLTRIAESLAVNITELICDAKELELANRAAAQLGIELLQQHLKGQSP